MKNILQYIFEGDYGISPNVREELVRAIHQLPEDNRIVIELHFIQKVARKTIAAQLKWSLSKVNSKITRGITLLKHKLNPAYFTDMNKILSKQVSVSS